MISSKAKQLLIQAHRTGRDFCSFDPKIESEIMKLGYGQYTTKPLMKLSYDGRKAASNWARVKAK